MSEPGSDYLIGESLGVGRFGEVFRGHSAAGPCAVRILSPAFGDDPGVAGRFQRDRALFRGVRDARVVRVHDLVVEDGCALAIVTDLVDGTDLRRALGNVAAAVADRLGAELAAALAALHAAGLAHGELKPENVLLDATGAVRLADFGLARLFGASTPPAGTATYRAPEVAAGGEPSPAADLYSLGVVLYELAAGTLPPTREIPLRPAGMDDRRWAVLAAMLAKDPAARPASARAVADLLAGSDPPPAPIAVPPLIAVPPPVAVPQAAPVAVPPAVAVAPAGVRSGRGRRRGLAGALAGAAVLGATTTGWALTRAGDPEPAAAPAALATAAARTTAPSVPVVSAPTNGPIAYVTKQDGVWRLYRMNADGTGQTPLTDVGADTIPPVFSPDGRLIAFVGYRTGEQGLYVMNVDGTGRIRLHESGRWPSFSPDGRRIAFDAMWNRKDEVHTINVDGTGLTRLTEDGRGAVPRTPIFSPDGTEILCTGYAGDDQAVFLMNADGTGRRELTPHGALAAFSPDGAKVAFTGTVDNEVYVMHADGTDPTRLTHNLARDWFPRFSPDGSRIVFTSNRDAGGPDSEDFGAYVMNADGSGQTRLLDRSLGRSVPAFSPDGTKIAVSALRGDPAEGDFDMYVLNADGTDATALSVRGANPVWGPTPRNP